MSGFGYGAAAQDRAGLGAGLPNDHLPPHFHLVGPDAEALVEIATLVVRGTVPSRAALGWAVENLDAVKAEWNRINPRFPIV